MKFVDYRSLAGHFAYMLLHDKHNANVLYVTNENINITSFRTRFFLKLYHSCIPKSYLSFLRPIWYRNLLPMKIDSSSNSLCFILSPSIIINYGEEFIDYIRSRINCKIVLVLGDRVESYSNGFDINQLKKVTDLICTYNPIDAKKYDILLHPGMVYNIEMPIEKQLSDCTTDVLFVGQEKGRGDEIQRIFDKCRSFGMTCDFYIVGEIKGAKIPGVNYCNWMPYEEVIRKATNAKSIINILQPGSSGVTMRDTEAYNLGCFLITSSPNEEVRAVLNRDQIINIENLDQEKANDIKERKERFLRKNILLTMDNFYRWIEKSL